MQVNRSVIKLLFSSELMLILNLRLNNTFGINIGCYYWCYCLKQRFSTWGTRTTGGTREARGGTQNVKFSDTIWLGGTRVPKG